MTAKCLILKVLDELTAEHLKRFIFHLGASDEWESIPFSQLENKTREEIAQLLEERYSKQAVDITRKVILNIPRFDLERMLPDGGGRNESIKRTPERKMEKLNGQDIAGTMSDPSESGNAIPKKNKLEAKLLTEKQLMKLASKLGHNWKRIGIEFLNLKTCEIDHCESDEQDIIMQRFKMLLLWRNREKKAATAEQLHAILANRDCPVSLEDIDWLVEDQ